MKNKEYQKELQELMQSDFTDIMFFMQTAKGVPHEMIKDELESGTLLDQMLACTNFRNEYPKIFKIQGNPYLVLNQKYFGIQPKLTYDEFKVKLQDNVAS